MQRRHAGLNFSTNEGLQSREEGDASAGLGKRLYHPVAAVRKEGSSLIHAHTFQSWVT